MHEPTDMDQTIPEGVALITFNTAWCGPCRAQLAVIGAIKKTFGHRAHISVINIDDHRQIAYTLGIQSVPTTIIFKDGAEIHRFIGLQPAESLSEALVNALENSRKRPGRGSAEVPAANNPH